MLVGLALSARTEQVVISEIMYHPAGVLPEYVELQNITVTPFDVANWRLSDAVSYEFPSFSVASSNLTILRPFERIVVSSADETTTRGAYAIPAGVRIYGPWSGNLGNQGERITLKDKNGVTMCTVEYDDRGRWSPAGDGAGHSLVLINPDAPIDDWRNWTVSELRGGTPGYTPAKAAETAVNNPEVTQAQGVVLLDYGARWRYNNLGAELSEDWKTPGYNDSQWDEGPGLLGKEEAALPPPGLQKSFALGSFITYYFRTRFTYTGPLDRVTVQVDQIVDDGAVYYLNGDYLGKVRIPDDPVLFSSPASPYVTDAVEETNVISRSDANLRQGENVLAVEVHQNGTGSSDLVFGARLRALIPMGTVSGVLINEVYPAAEGKGFVEFYNPGTNAVNLRGYFLSSDPGNLRQFQITTDVVVPARALAATGFVESGLKATNPVTVYLVAPDGSSVVNAIRADIPAGSGSLGRKPAGASSWYLFSQATRNLPNSSGGGAQITLRLNEVHFSPSNTVDWVELYNPGDTALSLAGLSLASTREFADKMPLNGSVAAGECAVVEVALSVINGEVRLFLVDDSDTVIHCGIFEPPGNGRNLQAFPDGSQEWFSAASPSRGARNNPVRQTDIVINEIMYDPPADEPGGEYIELFNRGGTPVDASGWRFTEGVNFQIPLPTIIPAGGYLVIAADVAKARRVYGDIPVLGNFSGRLSNNGETIRLVDQWGNLADEVSYKVRGDWPEWAKGGGTSMELLNPWMDNDRSSAWADSDETGKAPPRSYSYQGTYKQLRTMGSVTDYKEIYFHLVNEGHVVLENIQFIKLSAGTNLILRGDRLSTNNLSASGWLCQGTHWASYLTNGQLHIIAEGRGDNRPNRVEIDVTGINSNDQCDLRFDARWVCGTPRLVFSTWDHSIATSFLLQVPENLGTPGKPNSRLLASPPPQADDLRHDPPVPRSGDNVRITARICSVDPLAAVEVYHRPDNANADAPWQATPMYDDGSRGGDAAAGDGVYTAQLAQHKVNGRIVQFYVRAQTVNGQSCLQPRLGATRPAMYVVDDSVRPTDLRLARFVVSAYDLGAIANGNTAKYRYRFPPLSNHYKNATFISNEKDIVYNAEIRNSGSPWTRGGDLSRGKWKVPEDHRFRGHIKFYFDNDPEAGRLFNNRIIRYWLYLLGHPTGENEFIRLIINNGSASLREDTEPVADDFLDRNFENGAAGNLYRIDDEWWFTDAWDRGYRDADWSHKGTDNAGRYRTEWMKRTNEDRDDFSDLISFFKLVSGAFSQQESDRVIDPYATMQMFVVRGYVDDWDSFSLSRGKNGYFYRRASDGKFQFLHWDSDLTFGNTSAPMYSGVPRVGNWIAKPYNLRVFCYYLAELLDNYTKDSARLGAWLQAEEDASDSYPINASTYRSWCNNRNTSCRTFLGARYNIPFAAAGGGQPISTSEATLNLTGSAPVGVFHVRAEGHPEAALTWTGITNWSLTGLRLKQGKTQLVLKATDQWGRPVRHGLTNLAELNLTINKSGNAPPVAIVESDPGSWHVAVNAALHLDARQSWDPDGLPLTFEWTFSPNQRLAWTASPTGEGVAVFQRPGLYTVSLLVKDAPGAAAQLVREAAAYGPNGFSSFADNLLETWWNLENVECLGNYYPGPWYSLYECPGRLVLGIPGTAALPLANATAAYPWIWRVLPAQGDWALETQVKLESVDFGEFLAGLIVELAEDQATNRYAFGIENGRQLAVKSVARDGTARSLASIALAEDQAVIRVRRTGANLAFERGAAGEWSPVHVQPLGTAATALKGGPALATSVAQPVKSSFDYVLLIDPSDTSDLLENLVVSEIMYEPIDGDPYEFIELLNIGANRLDLTGARFANGITFTFGPTLLEPGERIVLAKDWVAFASRYGTEGIRVAPSPYSGRLNNDGEQLVLVDKDNRQVFGFGYGTGGDWPQRARGGGSSIELVSVRGAMDDPANWRASTEYAGSPGRAGIGPLRTVVINEVLTHSDLPLEDAVELFNTSDRPVDCSGWFLSDKGDYLKKFRLPPDSVIPPGGYLVLYEAQFGLSNPRVPFALSSARGDDLYLTAGDAAGNVTRFVDSVSFGASANGVSFGRYPNGVGPLTAMSRLTLGAAVQAGDPPEWLTVFRTGTGAANAYPKVGPVVFSEIMYHPPPGGDEYLALVNVTDQPVPLFDPLAPTNAWRLANAVEFVFPTNIVLAARERLLVVATNPAAFRLKYGLSTEVQVFGPWTGNLDNAGESLELYSPDPPQLLPPEVAFVPYVLVEKVRYDNRVPWPTLADGYGLPLRRVSLTKYGDDPGNWSADSAQSGRDEDADGMPDEWEIANGLDPESNTDAGQDKDGDGQTNLAEFLCGTDPQDPASALRVESLEADGTAVVLRFTARSGKSYTVQYCAALSPPHWLSLTNLAVAPTTSTVAVHDTPAATGSVRFYRIVTPAQ